MNEIKFGNKVVFANGNPTTFASAASDPGTAVNGDVYYNTTSNHLKCYVNGAWHTIIEDAISALTGDIVASGPGSASSTIQPGVVSASKLGSVTDGITLDQSGTGSTIEVKTGGISNAQIASAAAIALTKLAALSSHNRALQSDNSGFITESSVTSTELGYVSGVTSAIQTQLNGKLSLSGGTMTGSINGGGFEATNFGAPTAPNSLVTKSYADNLIAGLSWKEVVRLATAAALPAYTWASGSGGADTLTANSNGALSVDSVAVAVNDRILVQNETGGNAPYNGIYVVTATGSGGAPYVLTRATDMRTWAEVYGAVMLSSEGTVNTGSKWVSTNIAGGTLDTTNITFTAFSVSGTVSGSGTTNYVAYWSGAATLTAEQYLSATRGGLATDASGFTGVLKASSGVFSASAIVNSDIASAAAIALTKLAALSSHNRALLSDGSGFISESSVTSTELGYVSGVTSAIQTQLNGKANTALSNLASTAVNVDILPASNASINLGSAALNYATVNAETHASDTTLALKANAGSSNIDIESAKVRRSKDFSNFIEEEYIDSLTLTHNTNTSPASLQFDASLYGAIEISYYMNQATSRDTRQGTIRIAANNTATTSSASDMYSETADISIVASASITGSTVTVTFANNHATRDVTLRADVKRFRI